MDCEGLFSRISIVNTTYRPCRTRFGETPSPWSLPELPQGASLRIGAPQRQARPAVFRLSPLRRIQDPRVDPLDQPTREPTGESVRNAPCPIPPPRTNPNPRFRPRHPPKIRRSRPEFRGSANP